MAKGLLILFFLSTKQAFGFINFSVLKSQVPPDIYYFLPSVDFRFVVVLILWGGRSGLFFEEALFAVNFTLRTAFAISHRFLYGCVCIVICLEVFVKFSLWFHPWLIGFLAACCWSPYILISHFWFHATVVREDAWNNIRPLKICWDLFCVLCGLS